MIGERYHRRYPTVDVPPWPYSDNDPTVNNNMQFILSPNNTVNFEDSYANYAYDDDDGGDDHEDDVGDVDDDDDFRMYEFKVTRCGRGRSHDWTECPFVHPGEKARRRDPRKYHYSGTACPDFRKGSCGKGDGCEFAHGVFECWLHPLRYRTQPCKDGGSCKRRVCFFAHSPEQLRVVNLGGGGGGGGGGGNRTLHLSYSPESSSPPTESPPMSPMTVNSLSRSPVNDVMASLRRLQISRLNSMPLSSTLQLGSPVFGSPRRTMTRPGYFSLPVTPSDPTRPGNRCFDIWEKGEYHEEEPVMERVESGRGLRAKMFEKLSKENPLDPVDPDPNSNPGHNPDVGWVSDLIQ